MGKQRFIGEFEVSIDAKGRIMLPAALKRKLPTDSHDKFVMNRGFEKCLVLYPVNVWDEISEEVNNLNPYVKDNRDFMRYFFRGATELELDTASRFLVPKFLLEYAEVEKQAILFAYQNKIELWSKKYYHDQIDEEPRDFGKLAEQVMGKKKEE